jgi:aminopeptidase N
VTTYAFSGQEKASQAVLTTTVEALELYSKSFGEYPRQSLNVVEADFLDGMEYDGMYFLSKGFFNLYTGTPGEYLVAIAAHETAHQWWYAMVGNDQALEPWLDEALCTYMEHIYFENLHPEALDWWWTYRINYYQPRGWVDDSIYNPHGEIQAYRAYRDAVYLNGAVFLDELRKTMGDQAFFEFLKAYAAQNRDQIATKNSFFSLANQFSQSDLMPLIKQYFYHSE